MPYRTLFLIAVLALTLPILGTSSCKAFEFLHRRHQPAGTYAAPRYQQAARWYPQYQPMAGDNFGGGVQTYAYGYFGAKSHSAHGWHRGYYGDLYMWGPSRGR